MHLKKILSVLLVLLAVLVLYSIFHTLSKNSMQLQREIKSTALNDDEFFNNATESELSVSSDLQYTNSILENDYYNLALSLISLAEDGNSDAQFRLAEIISYCEAINAWKPDFERNFSQFIALNISGSDLRYMEHLIQEVQNCAVFDGQSMDIFSGQPLSGMGGLEIASLWYLKAAKQGHPQAVINALHFIQYISNVSLETKQQLGQLIKAVLPSLTDEHYNGLAALADNELDQLSMVMLGCSGSVECDSVDSVPLSQIIFYGCMESAIKDQIAGISNEPTNCATQGLNHYIAEQSAKYSAAELSERTQQIRQAAEQGDLQAMGLSDLAAWLQTDDTNK